MTEEEKIIYRKHLVALLYAFKDKPNLLATYMIEYSPLKKKFIDKIIKSSNLERISEEIENTETEYIKPFFLNLEEMQDYYNKIFNESDIDIDMNKDNNDIIRENKHPILGASTNKEALFTQLEEALSNQNYEKAVKLRDYIKSIGINLDQFQN